MSSHPFQVIDLRAPAEETSRLLLEAANTQGFLFIDGHSFSQQQVDALFRLSMEYFTNTPHHEKLQYAFDVAKNYGYTDYTREQGDPSKAKDFKECYNFGSINFSNGTYNGQSRSTSENCMQHGEVPPLFTYHNDLIVDSIKKFHELARNIMGLFTVALGIIQEDFFVSRFSDDKKNGCVMRLLHYPLFRDDGVDGSSGIDPTLRIGPHSDYGALTLLLQKEGEQGLEVQLDPGCDQWTKVPFLTSRYEGSAPPIVVNFGDMLSFWTKGVIRSTKHRVKIDPGETRSSDRYSIVFFTHPDADTTLDPVPSRVIESNSNGIGAPPVTAYEYLSAHLSRVINSIPSHDGMV